MKWTDEFFKKYYTSSYVATTKFQEFAIECWNKKIIALLVRVEIRQHYERYYNVSFNI